jgi:hypothetical protein
MAEKKAPEMQIEIDPDLQPQYSNVAMIAHTETDFIIDFAQVLPYTNGRIKARIILSPDHIKRLLAALKENVARYEKSFGEIRTQNSPLPVFNFGSKIGEA